MQDLKSLKEAAQRAGMTKHFLNDKLRDDMYIVGKDFIDRLHAEIAAASATPSDPMPRLPATPEEVVLFIGSHFFSHRDAGPVEDQMFTLSVHDLLSAFRDWEPVAANADLITQVDAVFNLMLKGCSYSDFSDWQNGDGEDIGARIEVVLSKVKAAALGALATPVEAVPGFKLVPIEPTQEMIEAGRNTPCVESDDDAPEDYKNVYKAMLAAAPEVPE